MATMPATMFPPKVSLTPNQLAELKKGAKANIIIGPDGNRFIGLESASVNLLTHFSPYAHKKLLDERNTVLCIPNGVKQAVMWIYKYMQNSEKDPEDLEPFADVNSTNLVLLYRHCALLEYASLTNRIVGRIKSLFFDTLPSAEKIKSFAALVPTLYSFSVKCLANEMINPWTCDYTAYLAFAKSDEAFGEALGQAMQRNLARRIKAGQEYYQRTTNREVLESKKYLDSRSKAHMVDIATKPSKSSRKNKAKKAGKTQQNGQDKDTEDVLTKFVPDTSMLQTETKKSFECFKCGGEGHIARNCTVRGAENEPTEKTKRANKSRDASTCFKCGERGHNARYCTATVDTAASINKVSRRPAPTCYNCNEQGHIARNCLSGTQDTDVDAEGTGGFAAEISATQFRDSKVKKSFMCFNCGGEGHIARNCTTEAAVDESTTAKDTNPTASHDQELRRARRNRARGIIVVMGNGEGLRTCDHVVKPGEVTRSGLLV